jgi:hypothetical protein
MYVAWTASDGKLRGHSAEQKPVVSKVRATVAKPATSIRVYIIAVANWAFDFRDKPPKEDAKRQRTAQKRLLKPSLHSDSLCLRRDREKNSERERAGDGRGWRCLDSTGAGRETDGLAAGYGHSVLVGFGGLTDTFHPDAPRCLFRRVAATKTGHEPDSRGAAPG